MKDNPAERVDATGGPAAEGEQPDDKQTHETVSAPGGIHTDGGDVAGRDIHYHGEGPRNPWRLDRVRTAELRHNEGVFVDVDPTATQDAAQQPLVVIAGESHSGRYATALACAWYQIRAKRQGDPHAKVRVWRLSDVECRLEQALEQVCEEQPGGIVIVRNADRGRAADSRLTHDDWTGMLGCISRAAQSHGWGVMFTVRQDFAGQGGARRVVTSPVWSKGEQPLDVLHEIFRRHGEAFAGRSRERGDDKRGLARACELFIGLRDTQVAAEHIAPSRIAALWDQFGGLLLDGCIPDSDDIARVLMGRGAQGPWFERQPFSDRVALVLVWLLEDLDVSALLESATAVLAKATATLHESALRGAPTAALLGDVARRLVHQDDLSQLQMRRRPTDGCIEFLDPALPEIIRERAGDYAFLLGPFTQALAGTLRDERLGVSVWRRAFGRALGRLGIHRSAELEAHLEVLWQAGRTLELREALTELCRADRGRVARVAEFLKSSGRLRIVGGVQLALDVLPAMVGGSAAAAETVPAGASPRERTDHALALARVVAHALARQGEGRPAEGAQLQRERTLCRILDGVVRSNPETLSRTLRGEVERCEIGAGYDFVFARLLALAVADALPAAIRSGWPGALELLADLLRCSVSNTLAKLTVRRALGLLAAHADLEQSDPFSELLVRLAWHSDMAVVRGLRLHLAAVLARLPREPTSDAGRRAQQRLAATARQAAAASGLVVRSPSAPVVVAGRWIDEAADAWRATLEAWLAPHAQVVFADTRDLEGVRDALGAVPPAGGAENASVAGGASGMRTATGANASDCPLVYLARDPDVEADVLKLSREVLTIGPELPTGRDWEHIARVRADLQGGAEMRLRAMDKVVEWWSGVVNRKVESGGCADDVPESLSEVVRLSRLPETDGGAGTRALVECFATGSEKQAVQARAALLWLFRQTQHMPGGHGGGPGARALEKEWERVRAALSGRPRQHWDDLWRAASYAGAPRPYVRPHGEEKAALVIRLDDAHAHDAEHGVRQRRRAPEVQAERLFVGVRRGLGDMGLEVQDVREEPVGRRAAAAQRSLEFILDGIRPAECAVVVLLGGAQSLTGERLIDLEDWRESLGRRLVAVDVPASLGKYRAQRREQQRGVSPTSQEDAAELVLAEILQRVRQQLSPHPWRAA